MTELEALEAAKYIVRTYYNCNICNMKRWLFAKDSEIIIKKIIDGDTMFISILAVENENTSATGDEQLYLVVYDKINNKISTYLYVK